MAWKSSLIFPFALQVRQQLLRDTRHAVAHQRRIMYALVRKAMHTRIGKELGFDRIRSYRDFRDCVPIRDYEGMRGAVEAIMNGARDILWPGRPRYFAKSSGTTSGVKYVPITTESIPNHVNSARNALFNYVAQKRDASIFDGKMIFISGSPELEDRGGIPTGRLSGIVNHLVPRWARGNQLPSFATNCIDDWETKINRIVQETAQQDMRLISGIPPWVQMYYERLLSASGRPTVKELFPHYSLFMYGGVNFTPYATTLNALAGRHIDTLETYPASEGFIAFQDAWPHAGLLLNTNSGIFFEFVPPDQLNSQSPDRMTLEDVELDKDYAIMINSNAGLWGYNIGDTVRFVSREPYRIVVSGRIEHFISAFGEHVIAKEVEQALADACEATGLRVTEFTVAPQVNAPDGGASYHEWCIEFDQPEVDLTAFRDHLETSMKAQNIYYRDLREGNILRPLVITRVRKDSFRNYMESIGKLGGQNKVPRLKNDRGIVEKLL